MKKTVPWYHSIITKLTLAFIVLILVIAGMSVVYTFGETKSALKETTRDELTAIASVIATQIDGDLLQTIAPGDEESEKFVTIRDQLYAIQNANSEILYVYTMRMKGDDVAFIIDAENGITEDAAGIDEVYDNPTAEMREGFETPITEHEFTTDEWGTVISGYAPILDSTGSVIGIVGVDMSSDRVIQRQDFIGNTIYIILLIGIIIAGLIIGFFSMTMKHDIDSLNETAERISMGDMGVLVTVERKDEIGELAQSFSRMVSSLKIMMMDPEEK
ncbi:MAG: HAMP domain-containing protein [Methanospirillaceae archaeon]|nr:HAMP domain-containing protein [Methanospirillaceae archaeon]